MPVSCRFSFFQEKCWSFDYQSVSQSRTVDSMTSPYKRTDSMISQPRKRSLKMLPPSWDSWHPLWLKTIACLTTHSYRGLFCLGCLAAHQQASVSQGQTFSGNFTFCYTETEVVNQICSFTKSQSGKQSKHWSHKTRHLAGWSLDHQF